MCEAICDVEHTNLALSSKTGLIYSIPNPTADKIAIQPLAIYINTLAS